MARVQRTHRFVLDPSPRQREQLEQMAAGRRAAYNYALALDRDLYAADLPPADWADLEPDWAASRHNERRKIAPFELGPAWTRTWRSLPAYVVPAAGQTAQLAFADYAWARDAAIRRRRGFPRFRSRHDERQGFAVRGVRVDEEDRLYVTNVGWLRVRGSTRRLRWFLAQREGTIRLAHLTREGVYRPWTIALVVEHEAPEPEDREGAVVGVDLGLKRFAALSTGEVIAGPKALAHSLRRLRRAQQAASRSEEHRRARETELRAAGSLGASARLPQSHRHLRKAARVSRLHARVAAVRREFHHALANRLVRDYAVVGLEDLAVRNLVRNHRLARSISDAGWSSFVRILEYKADEQGTLLVRADRFFPSSQLCSDCGARNRATRDLDVRRWACPACGVIHDRDVNAALNLVPSPAQIARARELRRLEREKQRAARERRDARIQAAVAARQARRAERQAHHIAPHSTTLAVTPTDNGDRPTSRRSVDRNARRGPVRPKPAMRVAGAVARTVTPLRREEARTEPSGLPIAVIDSRISLGALGPAVLGSSG